MEALLDAFTFLVAGAAWALAALAGALRRRAAAVGVWRLTLEALVACGILAALLAP